MAIGSALGGWAAAAFGYHVAFVINAASFLVSAYTVWLIPEEATRDEKTGERMRRFGRATPSEVVPAVYEAGEELTAPSEAARTADNDTLKGPSSFITELKEGFHYAATNHFALTILLMNSIWAARGGRNEHRFRANGRRPFSRGGRMGP